MILNIYSHMLSTTVIVFQYLSNYETLSAIVYFVQETISSSTQHTSHNTSFLKNKLSTKVM